MNFTSNVIVAFFVAVTTVTSHESENKLGGRNLQEDATTGATNGISALQYRPHHQCDGENGSTPGAASDLFNGHMDNKIDFVGLS